MANLDHAVYKKYLKSIMYYDVGAFPDLIYPWSSRLLHEKKKKKRYVVVRRDWGSRGNNVFLNKYIGIDPFFEANLQEDNLIHYKCVVSDVEDDKKDFYIIKPDCSSSLFHLDEIERAKISKPKSGRNIRKDTVICRKLSNIINENGGNIDVLKIDAHGSEYVILKDIEKYMKDIAAIQIEMWTAQWYEDAVLFKGSHGFLKDHSFVPVNALDPFQGISIDLLYINSNYEDKNKLDFIKNLFDVTKETIAVAEKEVKDQLDYCEKGNFDYQEWLKNGK